MRKPISTLGLMLACTFGGTALAQSSPPPLDMSSLRPKVEPFSAQAIEDMGRKSGLTTCFWVGTVSPQTFNILIPDSGVVYWIAQFKLPAGSELSLRGQYPHARHISFNTYDASGVPVDRINDLLIAPASGSMNPFLPNAQRDAAQRDYSVRLIEGAPAVQGIAAVDAQRAPNTVHAAAAGGLHQLWYRVYVPDRGRDVRGGVPLPQPVLRLADGRTLEGAELCKEIAVTEGAVRDVRLPEPALKKLFELPSSTTPVHPAQTPPRWNAFFNSPLSLSNILIGTPYEAVRARMDSTRRGGFYSTIDNTYMSAYIDSRLGDTLVLRARAPSTPRTLSGETTMQPAQLRYWSLCKYRSLADTAVDACLYDEQVALDTLGHYTILISSAANRPANARAECGVTWLDWGQGGFENPQGGYLAFRHMMPSAKFKQSLFATQKPGDEQATLGEYYPASSYHSKAQFEALGCPARQP